jgi:hypothetical protein
VRHRLKTSRNRRLPRTVPPATVSTPARTRRKPPSPALPPGLGCPSARRYPTRHAHPRPGGVHLSKNRRTSMTPGTADATPPQARGQGTGPAHRARVHQCSADRVRGVRQRQPSVNADQRIPKRVSKPSRVRLPRNNQRDRRTRSASLRRTGPEGPYPHRSADLSRVCHRRRLRSAISVHPPTSLSGSSASRLDAGATRVGVGLPSTSYRHPYSRSTTYLIAAEQCVCPAQVRTRAGQTRLSQSLLSRT